MGIAYYITLNRKVRFDTSVSGKAIAEESEAIVRICAKVGIQSPNDLLDMSAEAISFGVDPDSPGAQAKWFSASEGLAWVDALYEYIDGNPRSVKNRADVLENLDEFELVLEGAKKSKAKWHLKMDY